MNKIATGKFPVHKMYLMYLKERGTNITCIRLYSLLCEQSVFEIEKNV